MNVLFQALKMYLYCLLHPCTLIKHVQFVNNVLDVYSFCYRGPLGRMAISAKSVHLFKCCINSSKMTYSTLNIGPW